MPDTNPTGVFNAGWLRAGALFFRDVGFPAAVAIFVLWRVEGTLSDLVVATRHLEYLLAEMSQHACVFEQHDRATPQSGQHLELGGLEIGAGYRLVGCRIEGSAVHCVVAKRQPAAVIAAAGDN